tara:strand:- start:97 stop:306 length:210 start_codon:yes stop_codon:yes gene_type:complete
MQIDRVDQPEAMMCLAPIRTEADETAKRLTQRSKTLLKVASSEGFRSGQMPMTAIKDVGTLSDPIGMRK